MLMTVHPELEPLERLRASLPEACLSTFELLAGSITMPLEQPSCASVMAMLASSLVLYADEIPHLRDEFRALVEDAKMIAEVVTQHASHIQGTPPMAQMAGRVGHFPAFALLMQLNPEQLPLRVAVGAEIALALLRGGQLNEQFCEQLRRDADKYGRPQLGEDQQFQDLADLGFGLRWLAHFNRVDRQVRRQVEQPDPDGPPRPERFNPKNRLDLLVRLKWRFEYPDPKHRQAGLDDSHLLRAQYRRVTLAVRARVARGDSASLVQSLCLITRLTPLLVSSLPLVSAKDPLRMLGLDVGRGTLLLDLHTLFPGRKVPSPATSTLFHASSDFLHIPLPLFIARELRDRLLRYPSAKLLGDLTSWVSVNHTKSLIEGETCKLRSSLSRASKSTGAMAIMAGVDRLAAACITWDYSFIASSRMYYARLTGKDIHTGCALLYATMGWGDPALDASELSAVGSNCTLSDAGVKKLFDDLRESCNSSWPGRRSSLDTLLKHHQHYTRYVVVLTSFCLGLREVRWYRLLAGELIQGQTLLTLHDKQGGDRLMAQSVPINSLVREQFQQYLAHVRALHKRLVKLNNPKIHSLMESLEKTLRGEGLLFVCVSDHGTLGPAGNSNIWSKLPENIRVPGNVGRHFWQNSLRAHGLGSRDIDRFMRHRVVGLENNTNSQVAVPRDSCNRIEQIQLQVLNALGIGVVSGLRSV